MLLASCPISQEWTAYATRKATGSSFNKDTILEDGAGQLAGIIGELAFGRYLKSLQIPFEYVADRKQGYDFVVDGIKIDVKTKSCSSRPRPNYTAHVTHSQRDYDADLYVFARVSPSHVWLCGHIEKEKFWSSPLAADVKRGQLADGLVQHADARRIQLDLLLPMSSFKAVLLQAIV